VIPKLCSGIRFLLSRFLCSFLGCFWISGGGGGGRLEGDSTQRCDVGL
jgi:hypothetical protein